MLDLSILTRFRQENTGPARKVYYEPAAILDYDIARALNGAGEAHCPIEAVPDLSKVQLDGTTIVVSGVYRIPNLLARFGLYPAPVDYPQELASFYGRPITRITVGDTRALVGRHWLKPVPCKGPVQPGVFHFPMDPELGCDYTGLSFQEDSYPLWHSPPLEIVSEWRAFLTHGRVVDVRPYTEFAWKAPPDTKVIQAVVEAWPTQPAGCSVDFAVLADGSTVVLEVNDGYALGSYGLDPLCYFRLLEARWAEIWQGPVSCAEGDLVLVTRA